MNVLVPGSYYGKQGPGIVSACGCAIFFSLSLPEWSPGQIVDEGIQADEWFRQLCEIIEGNRRRRADSGVPPLKNRALVTVDAHSWPPTMIDLFYLDTRPHL